MAYSDEFLATLGRWQNGWREEPERRAEITERFERVLAEQPIPQEYRDEVGVCYRKRFLIPHNPQNGGDLEPLFEAGFIDDGLCSWTSSLQFAQDFKGWVRTGQFAVVFATAPKPDEVVLSIPALWGDADFVAAVHNFAGRNGDHADALVKLRDVQSEIILRSPLRRTEIVGIVGASGPLEQIGAELGVTKEEELDGLARYLAQHDIRLQAPEWLNPARTSALFERCKAIWEDKKANELRRQSSKY